MDWKKMNEQFDSIIAHFDAWQKEKCNGEWDDINFFVWDYDVVSVSGYDWSYFKYVRTMPFFGTADSMVAYLYREHFELPQAQALVAAALVYVLKMYRATKSAELIFGDLTDDILEIHQKMRDRGFAPHYYVPEDECGYYGHTVVVMPRVPKHIREAYSAKHDGKNIADSFVSKRMLPNDKGDIICKRKNKLGQFLRNEGEED